MPVLEERPEIKGRSVVIPPGINGTTGDQRTVYAGDGTRRIGGDTAYFRLWKLIRKHAANGVDCGEFYVVKGLPVSTRHNGGEGVGIRGDGSMQFQPTHWLARGWHHIDELPQGWEEINRRCVERLAEQERDVSSLAALAHSQEQVAALLARLMEERAHGAGDRTGAAPNAEGLGGAEAGGSSVAAPGPGSRRGARGEGR
jgi:hypothetical protein